MANPAYEVFKQAWNNFDSRPLKGEALRKFYVDDFTKDTVKSIKTTVKITERFRKILVIGHTGCGKSTILNKVAEELQDDYHVVSFSVADELNMMDIDTIDILTVIYMRLIAYAKDREIRELLRSFKQMFTFVKDNLKIDVEAGFKLLETLSFKIKVEPEARDQIRKEFKTRLDTLQKNITEACETITTQTATFKLSEKTLKQLGAEKTPQKILDALLPIQNQTYTKENGFEEAIEQQIKNKNQIARYKEQILQKARLEKDVLIIIDDLDKLPEAAAAKIFCQEHHLLTMLDAKIIFTFPLANYYSPDFNQISDKFEDEFIQLVNLYTQAGEYQKTSLQMLKKVVLKRIEPKYIAEDALKYLVDHSGGLLRDLIKFCQDACKLAFLEEVEKINSSKQIPQRVVQDKVNDYKANFDFPEYAKAVQAIKQKQTRTGIKNEHLHYLLRYLFVLEYGRRGVESWYAPHPCLEVLLQ
jgi:DNA polymerase III delta prime subunit